MVDRTPPSELDASSPDAMMRRVDYISDALHPNHIGKQILPARNYGCEDQSPEAFTEKVNYHNAAYYLYRKSNRLKGPTTDRLFDEIIYSTLPGAYPTAAERDAIERHLIKKFCKNAAVRTAWHIGDDGRADLHILMSAKQPSPSDPDAYEVIFGQAVGNEIAASIDCDRKIAQLLNANPDRTIKHKAAYDIGKDKKPSLAETIAEKWPNTIITANNIGDFLAELGHKVIEVTKKSVTLIYQGAISQTIRPLRELLLCIGEAQVRLKRQKKIAPLSAKDVPETKPAPALPPEPVNSLPPMPHKQAPTKPDPATLHKPNRNFTLLKAFLEDATGKVKVDTTRKVKLKKATKCMFTKTGAIKQSILDKLSDGEQAILTPLAEDYLRMNQGQ